MPFTPGLDTLQTRQILTIGYQEYGYYSLRAAEKQISGLMRLPLALKVLFENMLRFEDGRTITADTLQNFSIWLQLRKSEAEVPYRPSRILVNDVAGTPTLMDVAAMRDLFQKAGKDPVHIQPRCPIDLVIDAETFDHAHDRLSFLKWGSKTFKNLRLFPLGEDLTPLMNLEYFSTVITTDTDDQGRLTAFPDTFITTNPQANIANALGVWGWPVGGIGTETVLMGEPISMLIPEVVGVKLSGHRPADIATADLALALTPLLRRKNLAGKHVEFFGNGISSLSIADRTALASLVMIQGAMSGLCPIDQQTLDYLATSNKDIEQIRLVEAYAKEQGFWHEETTAENAEPLFTEIVEFDISHVSAIAPNQMTPQDRQLTSHINALAASQKTDTAAFKETYASATLGGEIWQNIKEQSGLCFEWSPASTYIKCPPTATTISDISIKLKDIKESRVLGLFGDYVTTDQIAPMDAITPDSPAGQHLIAEGVSPEELDTYAERRGNFEIVKRGTFSHSELKNEMAPEAGSGMTRHIPSGEILSIYDAAIRYEQEKVPLILFAGKNYGSGTVRNWASKGPKWLGVKAVIAESFDAHHRFELIGVGILPLEFKGNMTRKSLKLTGEETVSIAGLSIELRPGMDLMLTITHKDLIERYMVRCRIDSLDEIEYFRNGGILPMVLRKLNQQAS